MSGRQLSEPSPHPHATQLHHAPDRLLPSQYLALGYASSDHQLAIFDIGNVVTRMGLVPAEAVSDMSTFSVGHRLFSALDATLGERVAKSSSVVLSPLLFRAMLTFSIRHPACYWQYCQERLGRFIGFSGRKRPATFDEYSEMWSVASRQETALDEMIWPTPSSSFAAEALRFPLEPPVLPAVRSDFAQLRPETLGLQVLLAHWAPEFARSAGLDDHLAFLHLQAASYAVPVWATAGRGLALPEKVHLAWQFLQSRPAFYAVWCTGLVGETVQYSSVEHADQMLYAETQEVFLDRGVALHPRVWLPEHSPGFRLSPFLPPARRPVEFKAMFLPHPARLDKGAPRSPVMVQTKPSSSQQWRPHGGVSPLRTLVAGTPVGLLASSTDRADVVLLAAVVDHYGLHEELAETDRSVFDHELRDVCGAVRQAVIEFGFELLDERGLVTETFAPDPDPLLATFLAAKVSFGAGRELAAEIDIRLGAIAPTAVSWVVPAFHGRSAGDEAMYRAQAAAYARREATRFASALAAAEGTEEGPAAAIVDLRDDGHRPSAATSMRLGRISNAQHQLDQALAIVGLCSAAHPPEELQAACGVRRFGALEAVGQEHMDLPMTPLSSEMTPPIALQPKFVAIGRYVAACVQAQRTIPVVLPEPTNELRDIGAWLRDEYNAPRFVPPHLLRA